MTVPEAVVKRWATMEGQKLRVAVLRSIERRRALHSVPGLTRRDGLWDLRGLPFPSGFRWTASRWAEVNLDGAELELQVFVACRFERVYFGSARLAGSIDYGGHFVDVQVTDADWRGFGFGMGHGQVIRGVRLGESIYQRCRFRRALFYRGSFGSPWFEDCDFDHCAWGHTLDFYATHLRRVCFSGELFDTKWWGTCKYMPSEPNPMDHVDFSAATLKWPLFVGACDLERVQFAQDGKHWLIPRAATALATLQATLSDRGWSAEWQMVADRWMRNFARHATDTNPYVIHIEALVKVAGRSLERASARALVEAFLEAVGAEQPPTIDLEPPAPCRLPWGPSDA